MKKILPLLLLVAISCSQETEFRVEEPLLPLVNSFYKEAELQGIYPRKDNLIISIKKDLTKSCECVGLTQYHKSTSDFVDQQVEVWIDEDYFNTAPKACVESTVFHELAHAVLKRMHTQKWSIMNTSVKCFGQTYNNKDTTNYRVSLLKELYVGTD